MVKNLIGPIIKEVNNEVFIENKFLFFDLVKNATSNLVFGLINFVYDAFTGFWKSSWKSFVPGKLK